MFESYILYVWENVENGSAIVFKVLITNHKRPTFTLLLNLILRKWNGRILRDLGFADWQQKLL